MAPLIALLGTFGILLLVRWIRPSLAVTVSLAGRVAMAMMLLVTGISHFVYTDAMVELMPEIVPAKRQTVYITGIFELIAGVLLVINRTAPLAAIAVILFFAAILPANIVGSYKEVPLGGMENGPQYLWFRIPLQVFFIWWVWYFAWRTRDP